MFKHLKTCASLMCGVALLFCSSAHAEEVTKAVYHIGDSVEQAAHGLANIRNHLRDDPTAKIVVVTNGAGIRFLLKDTDPKYQFEEKVKTLADQGVVFEVCNNTLVASKIEPSQLLPQAKIIPAAVSEIARLQSREGYAYIRP